MEILTLVIALVALAIAIAAFQRTGGMESLRNQVERVGSRTEDAAKSTREATADALERVEKLLRGKQESSPKEAAPKAPSPEPADPKESGGSGTP